MSDAREIARYVVLGQWSYRRGEPQSGFCPSRLTHRPATTTDHGAKPQTCDVLARIVADFAWGDGVTDRAPLFVELCAGLASVSLMLQGGKYARPPVSRMGNKHGYGLALLRVMGLRPGQGAERFLWCEPDAGCRALLHAYTDREVMQEAARIIRGWKDEEPRELWERLRAEGPIRVGEAREVARATTIQRWMYGNAPVHNDGDGWRNGSDDGGVTFGANNFGTTATTANGMDRAPALPATVTPDARAIEPADLPPGTVMYADPPYVGTTGYGNDLPRKDVVSMARRWSEAGARVYISEAEPLPALVADGWHAVEITSERIGQKRTFSKQQREWVTCSVPPAWRPAKQAALF